MRTFQLYYSHKEPNTLYIDGKAYPLLSALDGGGTQSGRLFVLTENEDEEPLQTNRVLAYRNKQDLEIINKIARSDLNLAPDYKHSRERDAMDD